MKTQQILFTILVSLGLMSYGLLGAQTIYYVKEGGSGDGSSWNSASGDIQEMMDKANSGDQVWIAGGTYYPTYQSSEKDPLSKTFLIKDGVHIYGGFAGNETNKNDRLKADLEENGVIDPWDFENETILSGNMDGVIDNWERYIYMDNIWWWKVSGNDNNCSGRVITCTEDVTTETIIDGVSVTGGNSGGIRTLGNTVIQNCMIYANTGGRGVYNDIGEIKNCIVYHNADAGIQNIKGIVSDCWITLNGNSNISNGIKTTAGGGILNDEGEVINCKIQNNCVATFSNSSPNYGTDLSAYAGGIYNKSGKIDRCLVMNNSIYSFNGATGGSMMSALAYGGGIYSLGGIISNCCIFNNTATAEARSGNDYYAFPLGGGIMCSELSSLGGTKTTLYNTTILNNSRKWKVTERSECYSSANTEYINCIREVNNLELNFINPTSFMGTAVTDKQRQEILQANWNLKAGSGYIDMGSSQDLPEWVINGTDLAGNPRINNGTIDLGAYEYTSGSSIVELIQMDIAVYPNPASDFIIIKGIETGENIQMYNLNGQLVLSHKITNYEEEIKIDFLPTGIYLIKTSTGKMIKWIKK